MSSLIKDGGTLENPNSTVEGTLTAAQTIINHLPSPASLAERQAARESIGRQHEVPHGQDLSDRQILFKFGVGTGESGDDGDDGTGT